MKKTAILIVIAIWTAGCGGSEPVATDGAGNRVPGNGSRQDLETVTAHSADRGNKVPTGKPETDPGATGGGSWSRGGDPIDTSDFDSEIFAAEKALKSSPGDDSAKKALSQAYYKRGVALTNARQYAAALGDYRRSLKYDPSNTDAKNWIEQIIVIYNGLNKEYPKEGEEPPPLEFKNGKV